MAGLPARRPAHHGPVPLYGRTAGCDAARGHPAEEILATIANLNRWTARHTAASDGQPLEVAAQAELATLGIRVPPALHPSPRNRRSPRRFEIGCALESVSGPGPAWARPMTTTCSTTHSCQPPCCPNPNCPYHNRLQQGWRYKKIGFFRRRCSPQRIQRFLCLHCRRSFSCQTFSTTYYLKRPELLPALMTKTCGGMANRQIARDLRAAPSVIDRQLSRLGRHCLLFHQRLLKDYRPTGDIVIDGFESFEYSQYFPLHHHLAVAADSSFFIWFTDSEMRRKGRMRPEQQRRRRELERSLGRPDPKAIEKDMAELLQVVSRGPVNGGDPQR